MKDLFTPSGERCSIEAIKIGTTAVVRVTAQGYPEITADLAVSVITEGADPTVELLRLVPSTRKLTLVEGDEYSLDVAYVPSNTFQTGYSYTTDSNGVINVEKESDDSLRISAVNAADEPTILTITSSYNPDISTEVEVLVITEEQATKKLSSVRFFENSLEISPPYPEDEIRLNVFSYDSDGNEAEDTYTWRILEGSEHITFREIANESGTAGAKRGPRAQGSPGRRRCACYFRRFRCCDFVSLASRENTSVVFKRIEFGAAGPLRPGLSLLYYSILSF